jgi:hypothetical protein
MYQIDDFTGRRYWIGPVEVYRVTGPDGVYIGRSKDAKQRWADHLRLAKRGGALPLYVAIRKHGPEAFRFEVLACAKWRNGDWLEWYFTRQAARRSKPLYNLNNPPNHLHDGRSRVLAPGAAKKLAAARRATAAQMKASR